MPVMSEGMNDIRGLFGRNRSTNLCRNYLVWLLPGHIKAAVGAVSVVNNSGSRKILLALQGFSSDHPEARILHAIFPVNETRKKLTA